MKKKKNILAITLAVLLGAMNFNSCVDDFNLGDDFLEKAPGVDTDLNVVFSKAEYARYYLWNTYNWLYYGFNSGNGKITFFEVLSDCYHSVLGWDDAARVYYPGIYNAGNESGWIQGRFSYIGDGVWDGVRSGLIFIENIDRVPDMSNEEKERLKAEAKIIIATRYFDLLRHVGGLPVVDHVYTAADDFNNPRASIEETVNYVVRLCDEAAATKELPWNIPGDENENWAGRLTRASAIGLKCKVLLFAASPLFNSNEAYSNEAPQDAVQAKQVWYGGYKPELWEQCLKACEDFFAENAKNSNYYHLVQADNKTESGYCSAFRKAYWTRGNSEKIISSHKVYKEQEWGNGLYPGNASHSGAMSPTLEYMEMFPYADGTPFNADNIYNTDNPTNIDLFLDRDPRLYETLLVQKKGFVWQGTPVELWKGGRFWSNGKVSASLFLAHGMGPYKWILDYNHMGDEPVQWSYLRMGELHLIYAEALAETGNLPEACRQVNLVRERVGLKSIETCNPALNLTTNKENMINEILRERACELGMEDTRLHDMVRRKLITNFTKPLHGIRILRKDGKNEPQGEGEYPTFVYEKYEITTQTRAWWQPGFWTNKWLLSAMPIPEINKDYGLTQNPGW